MINFKFGKIISQDIEKELRKDKKKFEESVMQLGSDTAKTMKDKVKQSKKRSQAGEEPKLEKSITLDKFRGSNKFGWGVGNINLLDKKVPYWYFVNYGISQKGMIIPGRGKFVPPGAFSPGVGKPDPSVSPIGRWKTSEGDYSFQAKQGIRHPLRYIEKTIFWLQSSFNKIKSKLKG